MCVCSTPSLFVFATALRQAYSGGGYYDMNSTVSIQATNFSESGTYYSYTALGFGVDTGGCVYLMASSNVSVTGSQFRGCESGWNAGGLAMQQLQGPATVADTSFDGGFALTVRGQTQVDCLQGHRNRVQQAWACTFWSR